jgi:hypothetical protein
VDLFQPDSGWSGFQRGDERMQTPRNQQDRPARFLVLERNGERFTAQFFVQLLAGIHGVEVEGIIRNNQLLIQPKRVLRGANWENGILERPWQGRVEGEKLVLERTTDQQLKYTATLNFDPNVTRGNISGASGGGGRGPGRGRRGRGAP